MEKEEKEKRKEEKRGEGSRNPGASWFWANLVLGRVRFGPIWFGPSWFWAELTQERYLKGSRMGQSFKVSLWYASLLTNTRFCLLYSRISNCQAHLMLH